MWHVVSAWDGNTLVGSKVVGKTSRAAQPNALVPNHAYTIKVQAMDAQGNLSAPISGVTTTDMQSPMTNAAFFENFNEPAGNLDPNFFDVRTSHGTGLQPDSIGTEKMLAFGSENHFHTQLIGGVQRGELYIRPRIPFDFTDRTGTFQTEVDTAPVQHSDGKWFEFHLVRNLPWSSEEFGAGDGQEFPDSIEFSVRQANDDQHIVNTAQITVNIGGNVTVFQGTTNILTPVNVRMPVVLKVSRTTAQMLIDGVSVATASGFTLPFTEGYWVIAQRGWYASRDLRTAPVILQLIHWDTIQYDGPQGSYNSIAKSYIQPGCPGEVHNEHDGIVGCSRISFTSGHDTQTVTLNIPDNVAQARSAKILYNGSANSPFDVSINGHTMTIPTKSCCFLDALNTADFSPTWLTTGDNQVQLTYTGNDGVDLSQLEVEVVYNQQRVMTIPPQMYMPMLSLTAQSFRVDHLVTDPLIYTGTTYLYSLGYGLPVPFTATVISTETPWLTVSPGTGTALSAPLGGGVTPIHFRIDFTGFPNDSDGQVGVIKVTGGQMPVYLAVLAVYAGASTPPPFMTAFPPLNTTFDKNAIPDYHGPGNPTTTPIVASPTSIPTSLPTQTPGGPTATREPSSTPQLSSTPQPSATPVNCNVTFSDVPPNYWGHDYIEYVACHNIMTGYSDGTFRPNNNTTRGQSAKVMVLAMQWNIDVTGGPHFSDVLPGTTFYIYVETAYNHGLVQGYPDGKFHVNNNVTRGQFCKMMVLAEGWQIDTSGGPHFSDTPPNSTFYQYIETAYHHAVIGGYSDGTFRPNNNSTRAQIAKVVYLAGTGAR
jgi:hypothetical protein